MRFSLPEGQGKFVTKVGTVTNFPYFSDELSLIQ